MFFDFFCCTQFFLDDPEFQRLLLKIQRDRCFDFTRYQSRHIEPFLLKNVAQS
jgi:hypothetical protein